MFDRNYYVFIKLPLVDTLAILQKEMKFFQISGQLMGLFKETNEQSCRFCILKWGEKKHEWLR